MVSFHVRTLVWILVLFFVFAPIVDGNNKKHRGAHRHRHHRHRHRKHPRFHLPSVKNSSAEDTRKINMTKVLGTVPWFPMETSTSTLLSNSSYSDNEKITSLANFSTVQNTANIHMNNSIYMPNRVDGNSSFDSSNDSAGIVENTKSAGTSSKEEEYRQFAKDLREVFGSAEDRTDLPKILIDTPIAQLVRKKRSIASEEVEVTDGRSREPTLLDFDGPAIVNDPEETLDRESSESLRVRVKRDGSELNEMPSAISSQDSNYLHDLEDSFPLSALEVEARESQGSGSSQRKSRRSQSGNDSSVILSRPKRDADSYFENAKAASIDTIDGIEHLPDASSLDPFTGIRDRGNEIVDVSTPADLSTESVETLSRNTLDLEHPEKASYSLDSSTSPAPTSQETEDNKTDTKYVHSSSRSSDLDNSILKDDEPITGYRVEDAENEDDTSFYLPESRKVTEREAEEKNRQPEVVSASVDSSLKDDNSILRYRLDDVYPEIVEDPLHPSPMVQLVRTKRFGDGIVDPEAPDVSYANEVDNGRTADESYAEDNGIIDSMLSKVDYRSAYERNRPARRANEAPLEEDEIYSLKREGTPVRGKRGAFARRTRRKPAGGRRGSKKRKKGHRGRANKHHRPKLERSKVKRESDDLSERTNFESEKKLELDDENFGGRKLDATDREVMSPHDGRRRRESEDEDDENFYPDPNEAAGRYRRDLRDSGDVARISEADYDKEMSRSRLNSEAKNREKRDNALRELKYFENIRETDGGQNRSGEIADNRLLSVEAAKPIRDIEQLVEELLAKVNELRGYVNEGSANGAVGATEESQASGSASSIVDRTTGEGSKVVQRVTSLDDSSPRSAAAKVMRRPEACWKYPAAWTRQSGASKSNGKSARKLRGQRCSKKARRKRTSHRRWDRWTDWSSCSVTCGRGRQIRWRHCIRNCSTAETEMEEKACQLPACAPGKFLGIFG